MIEIIVAIITTTGVIVVGILGYRKVSKNKTTKSFSFKERLETLEKEFNQFKKDCEKCGFREEHDEREQIGVYFSVSDRVLEDLFSDLKSSYMALCTKEKILPKGEIINSVNFKRLENTFEHAKIELNKKLKEWFRINSIEELSTFEITVRAKALWEILIKVLNKFYLSSGRPDCTEIYDFWKIREESYFNTLKNIFLQIKDQK